MAATQAILCRNSGSSSLTFALYHLGGETNTALIIGAVERMGLSSGQIVIIDQGYVWV